MSLLLACPACAASDAGPGTALLLVMLGLPFALAAIGAWLFTRVSDR